MKGEGNPYWSEVFQNVDVADDRFHSWVVEWTPTGFTFLIDGIQQYQTTPTEYADYAPGFPTEVNLRIDLFIGSSWQGWPNDTDTKLPKDLAIDYIRHWEMP